MFFRKYTRASIWRRKPEANSEMFRNRCSLKADNKFLSDAKYIILCLDVVVVVAVVVVVVVVVVLVDLVVAVVVIVIVVVVGVVSVIVVVVVEVVVVIVVAGAENL